MYHPNASYHHWQERVNEAGAQNLSVLKPPAFNTFLKVSQTPLILLLQVRLLMQEHLHCLQEHLLMLKEHLLMLKESLLMLMESLLMLKESPLMLKESPLMLMESLWLKLV